MTERHECAGPAHAAPPAYFEQIRRRAVERWDQLEADPELAGPWHQLFKQVQSPRHILSELLQNADDARASEARVSIENDRFVFEHDGEDFVESHFASICRFGYSNKRALHTIGFRGIGFKSTFSLGDRVELYTPSLAVAFDRVRFTEPRWLDARNLTEKTTRIEVAIASSLVRQEVEKNLNQWLRSPLSLLFFKNIRKLRVGDSSVHWDSLGSGPIAGSEWMALNENADAPSLHVRSSEEVFPAEALDEIRKERMLSGEEESDFPPCRVEIVLGAPGRLYVVLPTGVETALPFACNAPFIQDPARLKIKDPETSPTNQWLLKRAGELAASAMLGWLEQTQTGPRDRADAYGLLPDVDRDAGTLEGACGAIVELAFESAVGDRAIVLTEGGDLVPPQGALAIPQAVFEIWPLEQAMPLLDDEARAPLCSHVSQASRAKLINWGWIEEFSKTDLLERLRENHLPRPTPWRRLLNLWSYIAPEVTSWQCHDPEELRIVPVQGQEVLYSASEVVRLGEKKLLQSDEDWEFLSRHLLVLNQNWTRFIAEQRRDGGDKGDDARAAEAARAVLEELELDETSDVNTVVEQVAEDFFNTDQPRLTECIQLAQIAAKLNVTVASAFRYVGADRRLRPGSGVFFDEDGSLESLLPEAVQSSRLLHPDYVAQFRSCSREEWLRWVKSGRSGLQTFAALERTRTAIYGRQRAIAAAEARGLSGPLYYPYVTHQFVIEDWDFPAAYWRHWQELSDTDPAIWAKVAQKILDQREGYHGREAAARLLQVATTGSTRSVTSEPLLACWILKLREKPCLPDTRGGLQLPGDLLRRTPETEALLDVEPFVHGLLDREATRPLLDLLGVRSTPTSPERLLNRLRALTRAERAPVQEVEKWYRRLDQMLDGCSTTDAQAIKDAFRNEKLILTDDGSWATSGSVFLVADEEDVPGAAIIRASVLDLSLWRRIGVADQPSADLALQWLSSLPSGKALAPDDARRVRTLLARYPTRIWEECSHWVNMVGEWVPTHDLTYGLSMQSLFTYGHLHDWVKQQTADLRALMAETVGSGAFSALPSLAEAIDERFHHAAPSAGQGQRLEWLEAFGTQLSRIELPDDDETERVREAAAQIARTRWVSTSSLELIPYLNGVPAGTARRADVLWRDAQLFVSSIPRARLAKRVPEEIGKSLSQDIRAALAYAFEREPGEIKAYLEENFPLGPERDLPTSAGPSAPATEEEPAEEADPTAPDDSLAAVSDLPGDHIEADTDECPAADQEAEAVDSQYGAPETDSGDPEPVARPKAPPQPPRPSVMERFARALGYRPDGPDRFFHADGSWICRADGSRFPWERRSAGGEVLMRYFAKEHCLEREPLQIEADLWGLLDQKPDAYAFVLVDMDGRPVETTGTRLRALRDDGQMTIHPATYRLVYDLDQ